MELGYKYTTVWSSESAMLILLPKLLENLNPSCPKLGETMEIAGLQYTTAVFGDSCRRQSGN